MSKQLSDCHVDENSQGFPSFRNLHFPRGAAVWLSYICAIEYKNKEF